MSVTRLTDPSASTFPGTRTVPRTATAGGAPARSAAASRARADDRYIPGLPTPRRPTPRRQAPEVSTVSLQRSCPCGRPFAAGTALRGNDRPSTSRLRRRACSKRDGRWPWPGPRSAATGQPGRGGIAWPGRAAAGDDAGMTDDPALDLLHEHYELGLEEPRLDQALGSVEFARTLEMAARVLPPPPAVVADIGGGPGRYALELAGRGYSVVHRDLVPLHVEQLRAAAGDLAGRIRTEVGDARDLDLDDDGADAVLLLGPLYHLVDREQRLRALREVRRVARPGAPVLVSAISRWAPRLHGYLAERLYERAAFFPELVRVVEESGRLNDNVPGWFTAYCHRPEQLRDEVVESGLVVEDLVGLEGLSFALGDLAERLAHPPGREGGLGRARGVRPAPGRPGVGPQ